MQDETPAVLFLGASPQDHESLGAALEGSRWRLESARTCSDARLVLQLRPINVLITERLLPDGLSWKTLAGEMDGNLYVPIVVVAPRAAAERLSEEVLAGGGFDVLGRPSSRAELLRMLSAAWRFGEDRRALASRPNRKAGPRVMGGLLGGAPA
jgi:DNA-binding NtrC family response regulator